MKIEDCRKAYYDFSRKTSEIVRYLALAGIAIIWIFKQENNKNFSIPETLVLPSILLIIGLSFDLLHAITGVITWGCFNRRKEIEGVAEEEEIEAPGWISWPGDFFFWAKILSIVVGYFFILKFLIESFMKK